MSQEEKAKMVLDDLADRLPEQYDMEDIRGRVDEVTPYVMVAIQVSGLASSGSRLAPHALYSWDSVMHGLLFRGNKHQPCARLIRRPACVLS